MAKARVLQDLVLWDDRTIFEEGEEVFAFWFDEDGRKSVISEHEIPEDCDGWVLHIQGIGDGGQQLWSPAEWDFDGTTDDAIEIIEDSWRPIRPGEEGW